MPLSPLADSPLSPLCTPFVPLLLTWNPPSCDRIRPPRSQVALNWPPLSQPFTKPSPLQIPRTPTAQRLTKMTSGIIRRLLSRTILSLYIIIYQHNINIEMNVWTKNHNLFSQIKIKGIKGDRVCTDAWGLRKGQNTAWHSDIPLYVM
jgi:hypothetical protein